MGRVKETVNTINTTIRTFLMVCVAGVLGSAGYVTYERFDAERIKLKKAEDALVVKEAELVSANETIAEQTIEIDRLDTAMHLLKVNQRLARFVVVDQKKDEEDNVTATTISFTELSPSGESIGESKDFTVQGDVVYFDNWLVKFDDEFIENADIARGTSLTLFRRVFGEHQKPSDGFVIDEVGTMPQAYLRGGEPNEFEKEIWAKFWEFANDKEKAAEKGIRAAHGQANSIKAEIGKAYRIELRASDGLSIVPEEPQAEGSST